MLNQPSHILSIVFIIAQCPMYSPIGPNMTKLTCSTCLGIVVQMIKFIYKLDHSIIENENVF